MNGFYDFRSYKRTIQGLPDLSVKTVLVRLISLTDIDFLFVKKYNGNMVKLIVSLVKEYL